MGVSADDVGAPSDFTPRTQSRRTDGKGDDNVTSIYKN
jgi:hypothetical protein